MSDLSLVAGAEREDSGGCPTFKVGWGPVISPVDHQRHPSLALIPFRML
jgi:hypothetical protein